MSQAAHSHRAKEAADACPYCGHEITHDEFLAIETRIAKEQQEQFDAREKQLNAQHMAKVSELHKQLAAKDKAAERQAEAARKAEREKIETERAAEILKFDEERKALDAERKTIADQEAAKEAAHQAELAKQRKVLNADHEKKQLEQKAAWDKENYRSQQTLADLQRKLEKKSNEELGDGAEVNLYNDLKSAFPDDVIHKVKKGVAGADIKHEIHVDGRLCGKIVYDSKNRNDWKHKYVEQLRNDQLAEKAEYAILATRKFPRSIREMTVCDGVALVNPARAVVLASLLRDAVIQLSSAKLSEEGKKEKQAKLYEFVTSTRCMNLFARFSDDVEHLRKLDEKEKTQQEKMRNDRAKHVGEIQKTVLGELKREIHDVLGL